MTVNKYIHSITKTISNLRRMQLLHWMFIFLGGISLMFIIAPLVRMIFSSELDSLFQTAKDTEVIDSIVLTLATSLIGTIIFAISAIPLAYLLARKNFPFKHLILGIINIPIVIPHTAAGIAVLGFVSRDTFIGKIGEQLGFNFVGHPAGIALAMAFVSLPFLITSAYDGFLNVPIRLEKAAYTLGASPVRVFFTISLPLAWRSIISGMIMMFARGISEFGAVVIIAYHPMITPVLIFERFNSFGLKYAHPVSVIFVVICLLFFIILRYFARKKTSDYARTSTNK